jgi:uncharacterized lipoprotein YddW (UPF0748 family)
MLGTHQICLQLSIFSKAVPRKLVRQIKKLIRVILLGGLLVLFLSPTVKSVDPPNNPSSVIPPPPTREFRGAWIATVLNTDWPSKPGLTSQQQQAELIAMLDRAVKLKLNAVIFQVRPACDALYASPYEPWSESLTGQMGKTPEPYYDPLAFAVEEAHKRGLELHAWFNPYRARHAKATSAISANHISKTHPEWVKQYGKFLWLDPGEKAVQDYTLDIILDVVRLYDIDGVHIDDYYYPYPERDAQNKVIDFPDEASWQKYVRSGGLLNRNDWRRENVNSFIERLNWAIKKEKSWVKFGISPFGIWRPGYPEQTKTSDGFDVFDPYEKIYADSRKWLVNGWLDYFSPQLYWKIEQTNLSYPVLLNWWTEQNTQGRHIWPGNFTSQVANAGSKGWSADEILNQIRVTRGYVGATGNIHFSMTALMQNSKGISDSLAKELYARPALVPASPWLSNTPPGKPNLMVRKDEASGKIQLTWQPTGIQNVWLWVIQTRTGSEWTTKILPGSQSSYLLSSNDSNRRVESVAVFAVNRYETSGPPIVVELRGN